MYKKFNDWKLYEGNSFGSGTSYQEWIVNERTNEVGLFKERKSELTTDNISEVLSTQIANIIGLPCAKTQLAIRDDRIGVVSYKINSDEENILEGIQFISRLYPEYDTYKLIDEKSGDRYSIEMILKSVNGLGLNNEIFKLFIFDFLIGNTDRHHSNWAIIVKDAEISLCPLYDNASGFCAYIADEQIHKFFNDKNWVKSIIDSKSKSAIRLDGKKVTHSNFVRYLRREYYQDTIGFVEIILKNLGDDVIDSILDSYNDVLSDLKIKLLKEYLKGKLDILSQIYGVSR